MNEKLSTYYIRKMPKFKSEWVKFVSFSIMTIISTIFKKLISIHCHKREVRLKMVQ